MVDKVSLYDRTITSWPEFHTPSSMTCITATWPPSRNRWMKLESMRRSRRLNLISSTNPGGVCILPPPPFELDATFLAADIQAADWQVQLPLDALGKHVMLIYVDIYGNEYTAIKTPSEWRRNVRG